MFFVLILRLRLPRYLTNTKRYPPKKFLETLKFFYFKLAEKGEICQISIGHVIWLEELTSFGLFFLGKIMLREQIQGFQKLLRGYLFVFVDYLCNRSPKIKMFRL